MTHLRRPAALARLRGHARGLMIMESRRRPMYPLPMGDAAWVSEWLETRAPLRSEPGP